MTLRPVLLILLASLLPGCKSWKGNDDEEVVLSTKQQKAYLSHSKLPQQYGFDVYPTPFGVAMRGEARLHPNQMASASFKKNGAPVIPVKGRSSRMKMNALLDPCSPSSWIEFSNAQEFKAIPLGIDGRNVPYRGENDIGRVHAYAAVITQLRIDQLFIENAPIFVRMAMNSLGPLNRGIESPSIDAVLGYDILRNFAYVQFNIADGTINFSASRPYAPHDDLLMSKARIADVPKGGLAVQGAIFGDRMPVLLDFAGDFHFARSDTNINTTAQVSLGDVVYLDVPTRRLPLRYKAPRAGRRMLEKYLITVCPLERAVYFERYPD